VILLYTSPFLVALVAVLMGRERMTAAKGLIMVLAFAGVVMAVGLDLSQLDLRGVAAGLTAAAGMVLMITVAGSWMQRHDPVSLCVHASLVVTPLLALYLLAAGSFHLPTASRGLAGAAGATFCYIAGTLCWVLSMRLVPPIRMAVILNLETPTTLALGAAVLDEKLGPWQLAGAAAVIAAVMALTLAGRRTN
jgi:drug/metabolite transporter (DMT)-like permease